jgi:hypothetical protein
MTTQPLTGEDSGLRDTMTEKPWDATWLLGFDEREDESGVSKRRRSS